MADISKLTLTVKKEDGTTVTTRYDIKDEIAREQLNAIPDGTYPDMTVGGVMSSDGSTDSTPYLYRASGGGVEVGTVEEDSIVGGTVAWNQLAQNGNFADTSGWSSTRGTFSVSNNICSYTSTEIGGGALQNRLEGRLPVIPKGHRVMFIATVKPAHTTTFRCQVRAGANNTMAALKTVNNVTGGAWAEILGINSFDNDISGSNSQLWLSFEETSSNGYAVGDVDQFKNIQIFDLTQMFGSSVADYIYSLEQSSTGAGVAFFRKLFPNDYYEYNTGELMSVEGLQSHDMVGFNQWDEEWIQGYVSGANGEYVASNSYICSKNFCKCMPNTAYYIYNTNANKGINIAWYDAEQKYIAPLANKGLRTSPPNAHYFKLRSASPNDYTSYTDGWCINLSSDRNGEYEPYIKHSYPLDSSLTLRGIPKLSDGLYFDGDTYEADGTVTRKYGVVDLGTLKWNKNTDTAWYSSDVTDFAFVKTVGAVQYGNAITSKYILTEITSATNGNFALYFNTSYSGYRLFVYDDFTGKNAAEVKAMLSGVLLVYELKEPTEETAEPYTEYQKVSKYGTEEYVSTGIVPIGHITKYPTDIVAKVNGLPSDFSTLIAPTEKEFKATRVYSVNQFIIIDNQLYRVTASIANGATITVGTNVVATTVADILTTLLNA